MNKILIGIKAFTGGTLTFFIYILGGYDIALECLFLAMVIDYLTGISQAFYNKNIDSKVGFKGLIKKFGIILLVCLSVLIDRIMGTNGIIRSFVIYYSFANEGISITENFGKMNILVPEIIKEKLKQLKESGDK